jgi:hypothetical protein
MVSDWVLGFYKDSSCPYRVVRAIRLMDGAEWEIADGFGDDYDIFPIEAPDSWEEIKHVEGD